MPVETKQVQDKTNIQKPENDEPNILMPVEVEKDDEQHFCKLRVHGKALITFKLA